MNVQNIDAEGIQLQNQSYRRNIGTRVGFQIKLSFGINLSVAHKRERNHSTLQRLYDVGYIAGVLRISGPDNGIQNIMLFCPVLVCFLEIKT